MLLYLQQSDEFIDSANGNTISVFFFHSTDNDRSLYFQRKPREERTVHPSLGQLVPLAHPAVYPCGTWLNVEAVPKWPQILKDCRLCHRSDSVSVISSKQPPARLELAA